MAESDHEEAQSRMADVGVRMEEGVASPVSPQYGPEIAVRPLGDRVLMEVRGELDLDAARPVERHLRTALTTSAKGVELDLGGVSFCDCSALNVLLALRRRALEEGKVIALRMSAPAVDRVLELTGTRELFPGPEAGEPLGGRRVSS